jgi:hypothetical protein
MWHKSKHNKNSKESASDWMQVMEESEWNDGARTRGRRGMMMMMASEHKA